MPVRHLVPTLTLLIALAACGGAQAQFTISIGSGPRTDGSGHATDETRSVAPFTALAVTGPIDVRLKAGTAERVTLHADDNLLPLIDTAVDGGKLSIGFKSGASVRTRSKLVATVEFRELASLLITASGDVRADRIKAPIFETTIRGSGDVVIDTLEADALALSLSGSGDFTAGGRVDKLGVVVVGSGDVRVDRLEAREAAIRIRGSGDVRVHAVERLDVDISGSGDVRYRGEPQISRRVRGSGDLRPLR